MTGKLKRIGSTAKVTPVATKIAIPQIRHDSRTAEMSTSTSPPRPTPYQRLQQLLAERQSAEATGRVITSVEELQIFLQSGSSKDEKVKLQMELVWASDHTYKQSSLVRLHFTDATSPETLKAQLALFRDQYSDNKDEIDSVLFTATIWDTDSGDEMLPKLGTVVDINSYSSLKLFRDKQCQANIKLRDLSWGSSGA
ncbi:hypothetical protein PHYPSEUDO_005362 [Phytophthora pseudosyringae]|uniref:Uncharacterized protein n=1 Tax=Phytophthora pseudosyringae TaxID=221518 RepID=A0A8T1VPS6_9STRA|nr:hypothetical protein PHYPSEUDO_005362 [Phytophthora pseudosyringae]